MNKIQKAREELRRKRETEGNLQQLLRDAQTRFHSLHQQNEEVVASNRDLQGKLNTAEQRFTSGGKITAEEKLARYEQELTRRNAEIKQLQLALQRTDGASASGSASDVTQELIKTRNELAQKEQAERILNKSLKEALGLLKPLHIHLEDAEKEKMEISKELRNLRKRFRQLQMGEIDDLSKSTVNGGEVSVELIKVKDELEETVRQLELENSQLHDALEDVSEFDGADQSKVRQRMVELNSRYEVTQNKLEDAHVENHSLVKELKHKELQEKQRKEEIRRLNERLQKTEKELSDAKAIVDEFAMPNVGKMNRRIPTQRQMV
jgi:chromosome segregation ATPase